MSAFFLCSLGIPRTTLPVFAVGRSRLVKAFPPHGVVVEISAHIGVYGILPGSHQGVVVGLAVGARSYSEEAVFRIDGIKSSVFAYTEPGDVVADGVYFVAFLSQVLRRYEHSQIGLAAGARESGAYVTLLAVRTFDT